MEPTTETDEDRAFAKELFNRDKTDLPENPTPDQRFIHDLFNNE